MAKFKVGDRVRRVNFAHGVFKEGDECVVSHYNDCLDRYELEGDKPGFRHDPDNLELIAPATTNPVRERTVTEIVPGIYGRVRITQEHGPSVGISFTMRDCNRITDAAALNAAELSALIDTLTPIRDHLLATAP